MAFAGKYTSLSTSEIKNFCLCKSVSVIEENNNVCLGFYLDNLVF